MKILGLVAAALVAAVSSVPAMADTFSGICTLSGTATLTPPLGVVPSAAATFNFTTNSNPPFGAANLCTGVLNGAPVTNVAASATASGSGMVLGLGCTLSTGAGSGVLTIAGTPIAFSLTIAGAGPQVNLLVQGSAGGAATGQASFATDTNAATDCASSNAGSLDFVVAATATNLAD